MSYREYIRRRLRYGGLPRLFLEAVAKAGINIRPFILCQEGIFDSTLEDLAAGFEGYETRFLNAGDMGPIAALAKMPGRDVSEKELQQRFHANNKCFAMMQNGQLAAFTWCDLTNCTFQGYPFPLKANEAYLFDAYTFLPFRGRGLAPYMRYLLYVELAKLGRDTCYSVSERFNLPSLSFKAKLKAKKLLSGIYVVMFSRWRFSWLLKEHARCAPARHMDLGRTRPGGDLYLMYAVELRTTIKDVDAAEWDRLARDVYISHGWLRTMEEAFLSPVDHRYFLVLSNGSLVGAAVCHIQYPTDSAFTLDDAVFGRFRKVAARIGLSVLPSFICGPQRAYGQHFLLDEKLTVAQRQAVAVTLLDALEREASSQHLSVCFNNVMADERELLPLLKQRGYAMTMNFPLNRMDIRWKTFNGYKRLLAKRKHVREMNKNLKEGVTIRQLERVDGSQDRLHELLDGNYRKYNKKPLPLRKDFVSRCKEYLGRDAIVYIAEKEGIIVGTTIMFHRHGVGYFTDVGVDHKTAGNDFTYFNVVYYRPIADAIAMDLKRLHYGTMMYDMKARRGCTTVGLYVYYKSRFSFLQAILIPLFTVHAHLKGWFIRHLHA